MQSLYKWIIGDMGTPGEYAYQAIHLYTLVAVFGALVLAGWLGKTSRLKERHKEWILLGLALFHLCFEVVWRLLFVLVKGEPISCWWPAYPCNLGGILVPLAALLKSRKMKRLFYMFGFLASIMSFLLPDGIYVREVLTFPILKSILQHTGLLLIPMFELTSGTWHPNYRDFPWVLGGSCVHILNCEVIDRFFGFTGDYLFLRGTLPFVIPGVPQWITVSVLALLILGLACILCDVKAFGAALRQRKERRLQRKAA